MVLTGRATRRFAASRALRTASVAPS